MKSNYFAIIETTKGFKSLSTKAKRNIRKQIHNELDNTGNFKLKSLVSSESLQDTTIIIPFRSRDEAIEFKNELFAGMHPSRSMLLKIVGRRKESLPSKTKKRRISYLKLLA